MRQLGFMKSKGRYIDDISVDFEGIDTSQFDSMGSLKDDELEFMKQKRMHTQRTKSRIYTPDPRLGDYEA